MEGGRRRRETKAKEKKGKDRRKEKVGWMREKGKRKEDQTR